MTRWARSETTDDPVALTRRIREAMDGGDPVLLGGAPDDRLRVAHDVAAVVATSGSTGVPKKVALSARALQASAAATAATIGAGQWMLALPTQYVAGLQVVVRSLLTNKIPVPLEGPLRPDSFVTATQRAVREAFGAPTFTSLVPAQLGLLVDAAEDADTGEPVRQALHAYQAILVGGQSTPASLAERAHRLGARIVRTYGSSETAGGCVYDGQPLPGVSVRVVDGELQLSGPMLAEGYVDDPQQTAEHFVRDAGRRWYRTGDSGDYEAGTVRVTGRRDRVFITGGTNVSLDRVENVVRSIRHGADAVVVALPHERWGQCCVIVTDRHGDAAAGLFQQAREAVAEQLGKPARPTRLLTLDPLPRLVSGKPDREAITEWALRVSTHTSQER